METANNASTSTAVEAVVGASAAAPAAAEEATAKVAQKRYAGLMTVRTKAMKGKGAWYWAHLEPILVYCTDTRLPKAVKLRCSLCDAVFSASNPSRTASEHLKRGTCPNFATPSAASPSSGGGGDPKPISSIAPFYSTALRNHHHQLPSGSRKRSAAGLNRPLALSHFHSPPLERHLVLSGGKEDLDALAMLENSVQKLKSPKVSPGPLLSQSQSSAALALLSDWFYESSAALSSADHPKFHAFLRQIGLPPLSRRDLAGPRLDARYDEARADAEARIRDALFFQISSDGWQASATSPANGSDTLVSLAVNLPNGSGVFGRAVFAPCRVPSEYAEEIMWSTAAELCGNASYRCVGIVADRFKSKALRNLENHNHWMVNLSCQLHGFRSLVKDFARELPVFRSVLTNCSKLAGFFNTHNQARRTFHKYQIQELDHAGLLRVPQSDPLDCGTVNSFAPVFGVLEDILGSARPLQLAVLDESYKLVCVDDPNAREFSEMIRDSCFWNDLEAVHSLTNIVQNMVQGMEADRPLVGQCLPIWDELRSKVKDWCTKFSIDEGPVMKVVEKRFKKNYHPAWSAAFILDPLYLTKDTSGKYLPPFKCLTPDQERDVDKIIMRLVSREEAHIALMELMKWRSEGLDPLYAQAVQMKQPDPVSGKMRVANPQGSRIMWERYLSEFKSLGKVASRLIFLHATVSGFKCDLSLLRWACAHRRSRTGMDRAQKMVFVAAHAKLRRRDFSIEEKDAMLFANGEDDVMNEAFVESSSV